MMFLTCSSLEEMSSSGTSYLNRGESATVERLVSSMLRSGLQSSQIGVITPYEGQRTHVQQYFGSRGSLAPERYEGLEIASVDSFQGREKDFIILSCVRSNEKQGIGFLADPRRLNVALTRARFGLVVIGNARVLAKQLLWHNLLHHFQEKGVIYEGVIGSLRPSKGRLPTPKQYVSPQYAPYYGSLQAAAAMAVQQQMAAGVLPLAPGANPPMSASMHGMPPGAEDQEADASGANPSESNDSAVPHP